ncbi:MAG TPA: UDP-N-acetylmuramoyl-tripeptide--D-alanyl-D-alanine ligase [Rariglobus sp.]|nr:UDP-N-acetylmuramoyl-tripeptide--D-alanyl-D-alanine ligase [Rariglobus sp.]
MPVFSPETLAAWTSGKWTALPTASLTGFTMDTRQLRVGQVFVALKTEKRDGHDFLHAAQSAGASAAIVARASPELALPQLVVADPLMAFQMIAREHRRTFRGPVVGISGSAGKTSTKNLLALLLGDETGGVLATEGNLNNHIGVPLTLTRLDPVRHKFAVIEAGISSPGEMAPLAAMIEPDLAINTLVAPAHVEALGSLKGVAREKAVLPAAVRAGGVAVFPRQSLEFAAFRELGVNTLVVESAEVLRPTAPPKDRVYFTVTHRGDETALAVAYGTPPPLVFTLRRVSAGMAQNAVMAVCAALWLGVKLETVQARLVSWQPAKLRGELRREDGRLLYLDCYNANPAAMGDALDAFYAVAPETDPRLLVIGCMGELGAESAMYHRALGRAIHLRKDDYLMVIGDDAEAIRQGALENGLSAAQVEIVASLEPVKTRVTGFRGAVFIKGSRRYQLETILQGEAALTAH